MALSSVCVGLHLAWSRLSDDSKSALQRRVAIIGTPLLRKDYWDRLHVFSESGYRLERHWLPRPRRYPACAFDGSHLLYVLGGCEAENRSKQDLRAVGCAVDCFNLVKQIWSTEPNMPTRRLDFSACCVDKEVLAIGGFCPAGRNVFFDRRTLSSIDACQLSDGSWEARQSLHFGRYRFGLASIASRVYVIGGEVGSGSGHNMTVEYLDSVEVITEAGKKIRTCTTVPSAVAGCCAVAVGHRILIIGGHGIGGRPQPVQIFNTVTESWAFFQRHPRPICVENRWLQWDLTCGICVQEGGCVRVFGGYSDSWGCLDVAGEMDDVRIFGGTTVANKFCGEVVIDDRLESCEVCERSRSGFAFGVAVPLHSC